MHSIEMNKSKQVRGVRPVTACTLGATAWLVVLAGCSTPQTVEPPPPLAAPAPLITKPAAPVKPAPVAAVKLPPPGPVHNWNELRVQAAKRMVAANPEGTYMGKPQQMLLAIPVLEMELNADGSIKNIDILRKPSQAFETTQMAIDAVRRAAPFGDVSKLPKPWKFSEAFLFNDDKRFKPRTLD